MMKIEVVTNIERFEGLREEWNSLLNKSSSDTIFLTWEWLYTWWKVFGNGRTLFILLCRDNAGVLQGIFPLCLGGKRIKELRFIGEGADVSSEYLDIICASGREGEIVDAFMTFLINGKSAWHVLRLSEVYQNSTGIGSIAKYGAANGINILLKDRRPFCPVVTLPDSWEGYLRSLPKRMRSNIRRERRNVEKKFDTITVDNMNTSTDMDTAFNRFVWLHAERREQKSDGSRFDNKQYEKFHKEIFSIFSKKGWVYLYFLNLNGQDAAVQYGFRYNNTYYFYQSGLNPKFFAYGAGQVLIGYVLERAVQEGIGMCDLLRGEEWYKMRWANDVRKKSRIVISNGKIGDVYVAFSRAKSNCLHLAKQLLPEKLKKTIEDRIYK